VGESIVSANPATREMLARCYKMLVHALEENRRIAHNLRPSELDELGLASASRNFCEQTQARTNLKIECTIPQIEQRVAQAVELNLFRILQEAMANIERHAEAKNVKVSLSFKGEVVTLKIQDDGCGFDVSKPRVNRKRLSGIGLTNIRERAASMSGTCDIHSAPQQGTTITVHVPM
jgi:signal transduction histidine kinase